MRFPSPATWLAFFAFVIVAHLNVVLGDTSSESASAETLQQLKLIEESVNLTADPCDDFYNYACGNWERHHPYFNESAMYTILYYAFRDKLAPLLSWKQEIDEHNQTFVEKTLAFSRSCLPVTTQYFDYVKPGNDLEWPLINEIKGKDQQENFDSFDVFGFLGKLFSYGMNNVIIKSSVKRLDNGTLHIKLSLPTSSKTESSSITHLLLGIGFYFNSEQLTEYTKELQSSDEYWHDLRSEYKHYNTNEDIVTYAQVKDVIPKLARFLENMLPEHIQDDDVIQLTNLNYLEFLLNKDLTSSDVQKLCNHLMSQFYVYLEYEIHDLCYDKVLKFMHLAVDYLFYETYMKRHEELYSASLGTLLKGLKKYTLAMVDENNLKFSDNMIEAIKEKLNKLHTTIGNLPENVDVDMVEEFYSDLPDMKPGDYYQNAIYILKHRYHKRFDCPKHVECGDEIRPVTLKIPKDDLMILPFASLTPPMYHWNFDPLFTVSLLGTLIGHEFTHSMDTSTLTSENVYSLHEDFNNHPELNEAKECMLEQAFSEDIRERVADFAGARAAYQLYAKEYNTQPKFSTTPWQQLFYLNMAQYFCQQSYELSRVTKHHDSSDVRLRQIAMNSKEFAEAFNCPVGSNMNPEKKCRFY